MNLSLQPTASSVILTVLVMAAGIWMSYIACKRNRRPLTFKLEILRLAILGFICFLLFQPEWLITSSPQEKPKVSSSRTCQRSCSRSSARASAPVRADSCKATASRQCRQAAATSATESVKRACASSSARCASARSSD